MINTINLTAGQRVEFREPGDFFRVLAATAVLTVEFYENGREIAEAVGIGAGYAEKFERGNFDRIAITSATAQTVQFVTRLGNTVQYDAPPTGDVTIAGEVTVKNKTANFDQGLKTGQTVSTILLSAVATRSYLLIQNKDTAVSIYINLKGSAASVANGILIEPGGSLEVINICPTGNITVLATAYTDRIVAVEAY